MCGLSLCVACVRQRVCSPFSAVSTQPPANLEHWIHENARICGYIVLGVIVAQALAMLLAVCQRSSLIGHFDSDCESDEEGGRSARLLGDGRQRYRERNAAMYSKYSRT